MSQQEYVNLDRKYIKLIDSSSLLNIENTSEALSKRMYDKPQNIADIVRDNKIVVILGDKGSGKTTEISQFYEKHKDNSIYIELKNIYSDIKKFQSEISLLKEPSTLDCLYLLFDSIDECRMQTRGYQDAFEIVLEKIRTVLLSNPDVISKIKFIFTSRESDWRKISDDLLLRKNLTMNTLSVNPSDTHSLIGNSTEVIKNEITVSVFALKELDTSQKVLIAKSLNVNEDFFKDDVIAQEYSNTPLDCFEFIRFRLKNRNASYKLEDFLSFKLQWRYRELNEARTGNQLSIKKIEYLSKRLAVATLFCETISIKKNESYFDILKATNDVSTFELFPEEDSSCLKNFLDSSLFLSNAEGSVKFWNELSRDHIAHVWFKDRIANGKYYMIKSLLFQNYECIISPRKMFIVPIVFLANNEPEFRNYLIKFNPELLVFYSYCCESLTEFDKKNILNNLFKKYPYRIRHITSSFFNNTNKAFIFFTKGLDIKYIIRKIKQTERDDFWREYFLIKLLFYSDIGKLDKKVRGKVNAMLFSYIYYGNNRDFASTAIEILLMQKQLQINQKLTKYLTEKTSKISEYTINTFFDYLYPKFISFIEAVDLLDKYIKEMEEDISVFYLKVILKNLMQQGSDIHGLKTALDTIHFDFSKESSLSLYIILLIAYIDYGGNDESVAEYLFKLQEYNVLRYGTIYSPYKSDDELKELKAKITSTATISLVEKIIDKYILLDEKNIWSWLEYDYLFKKDENLFKMLLEKSNTPSLPENKVFQLFRYCLHNLQQISPNNYKEIVKPYLNSKYKRQIWKNFLNPKTPKWKFKQDKRDNEQKIKKEKELNFLLEHIDDIKKASEKYQYILIRLSLENGMNESSDISRIENMWGKNVADAYKQGIQKYWQIGKVDFNQYLNEVIGTNQILNQTIASLTGLHIFFKENIDANITEEQARRVIYWGIQELNSIPEWAVRVIQKHSMVAKDIILPVIDKIIEINKDSLILDKFSRIDSNVLSIFYEDLWVRLQNNPTSEVIQNILKVLIRMHLSNTQKEALVSYIDSKIDDIKNKDVIKWFELLYVVSLDEFTKKIFEFNTKYYHMQDEMKDFFEQLFGKLNHRQIYENKNVTKDVYKLLDLLPLLFKYINPQDDIIHKSGVAFTPSIRDNAQDFRNDVLNFINIINFTIHDRKYLLDLSSRIKSKYPCDSINYVADELLMKDSVNLSENDVIKIENLDYLPPKNSDDLFRIVCDKINEVKMDIETSDYSIKKLYQDLATTDNGVKIKKEEHFQKYMLMELRRLSRNLYSLVREPEVANNKKPDLQVWDKNWCINIECKIADNWPGEKILETVELQLVKKYLQYPKYQYGILLLARISKKLWELDTEKKSFFDLIESIQKHSDVIKNKYSHIKEIKILGIDYSLPL